MAAMLKGEMRPELADAPHFSKRPVAKVAKRSQKPEEAQREEPCGHNRRKGVFFNIWTTQLAVQRLPESNANSMKAAGSPALPPPISPLIPLDTNKNLAPAKGGLSSSFSQDSLLHVNHRFGLCRAAFNPIHFPALGTLKYIIQRASGDFCCCCFTSMTLNLDSNTCFPYWLL